MTETAATTATDSPQEAAIRARIDLSARWPVLFFLASAGFWLLAAMLAGIVANIKLLSPSFLGDWAAISYPRLHPMHISMLVYGFGINAGLGISIWLMARLCRQEVRGPFGYITAGVAWNTAITLGVLGVLAGFGSGADWLEFPRWVFPLMFLSYAIIAGKIFVMFLQRDAARPYVSVWFLLAALFAFPWLLLTAWVLIFLSPGAAVMSTAIATWYVGGMLMLFFVPLTLAITHYFIPKVSAKPLHSENIALFGLWGVLGLGAWSGMQRLMGGPLPAWMPAVSGTALLVFLIPALLVFINHIRTLKGAEDMVVMSPTLRFNVAAQWGFLVFAVIGAALSLLFFSRSAQFSQAVIGYWHTGLYGMFAMAAFGAIVFIMPRICGCEWFSAKQLRFQFWFSVYGAIALSLLGVLGGLWQGAMVFNLESDWRAVVETTRPYTTGRVIALMLIFLSNLVFVGNLWRMILRKGREAGSATLIHEPVEKTEPASPPAAGA